MEILARSESVMKRSDELKPINSPNIVQEAFKPNNGLQQTYTNTPQSSSNYYDPGVGAKGIGAKNLPPQILAIMEGSQQAPMNNVDSGIEEFIKHKKAATLNENVFEGTNNQTDVISISKTDLKEIIKEAIDEAMKKYKKVVEETTIKRTITTLLKEQKKRN